MRPSTKAWIGLAAGISAYEIACPRGETMSEGLDTIATSRLGQLAILGVGTYLTAHLANLLPPKVDVLGELTRWKHSEGMES